MIAEGSVLPSSYTPCSTALSFSSSSSLSSSVGMLKNSREQDDIWNRDGEKSLTG